MNRDLSHGTTLSHYRIVSKLGAGGMGEVYLARDTKLDRKVALKILPADVVLDRAYNERSALLAIYLTNDPRMDSLRSDPRFGKLKRRVGLPE